MFVASVPFLLSLGYSMLLTNYRGSHGYGEDPLQSLPGNVGTNDVADCIAALDHAVYLGRVPFI